MSTSPYTSVSGGVETSSVRVHYSLSCPHLPLQKSARTPRIWVGSPAVSRYQREEGFSGGVSAFIQLCTREMIKLNQNYCFDTPAYLQTQSILHLCPDQGGPGTHSSSRHSTKLSSTPTFKCIRHLHLSLIASLLSPPPHSPYF